MNQDEVLTRVQAEDVRLVRFLCCDNGNVVRGKAAHAGALADFIDAGVGPTFGQPCDAHITSFGHIPEADCAVK